MRQLRGRLGGSFAESVTTLSVAHVVNYLIPLLLIPYLTRVLEPGGWGLVAFAQSFGFYLTRIVEFGFDLSGTREAARHRDNPRRLAEVLAAILGAKLPLAVLALAIAVAIGEVVPAFREHRAVFWSAILWGLGQSFSMVWFFQALERLRWAVFADVLCRLTGAVGIVVLVNQPEHAWRALALQGTAATVSAMIGVWLAYRVVVPLAPTVQAVRGMLRAGSSMFLFRCADGLYTVGTPFLLGLLVPPQVVGYFAAAERIARAALRLIAPISGAVFPRMNHLVRHAPREAAAMARLTIIALAIAGATISLVLFIFAAPIVHILLGPKFASAVPTLELLALLPFLAALSHGFGYEWILPLGLDRSFVAIAFAAGLTYIALALALAPAHGDLGMALAVVLTEFFVIAAMFGVLRLRRLDPFSAR